MYTLGGDNVAYIDQMTISTENKTEKKDENGNTVKENGNIVYVYKDSFAKFGIRNNTDALKGVKSFKVLVGGTDVAEAGETTITLGSATPTGYTATFKDGVADASDPMTNKTTITLPDVPDATVTRYYVGWTVEGSDGKTVLKPGTKYTLTANTQFNAKYYGKGDVTKDGYVDGIDANIIYYAEVYDEASITAAGCSEFWDTEIGDELSLSVCDVTGEGNIDGIDANMVYYAEVYDDASVIAAGCEKFWEDR